MFLFLWAETGAVTFLTMQLVGQGLSLGHVAGSCRPQVLLTMITALGIMIGLAVGVSGALAATVSGLIIDGFGFGLHYVVLAAVCLLGLVPLARTTETVRTREKAA